MKKLNQFSVPGPSLPRDNGNLVPGELYLANESRFAETYYSEPLTTYLVGWTDPNNIEATLDFIAPPVDAPGRLFEFKKYLNAEEFYSEVDDTRAINADFKRIEYRGQDAQAKTINKGLTIRLDLDQYPDLDRAQQLATGRIMRRLLRNELRRASAALGALTGAGTALTWDTSAGKDPDQDVLTALISATDDSGIRPNRVLYGEVAWNKRGLAHRAQNTAGGFASSMQTPDQLAAYLGLDGAKVSKERYQQTASTKTKIVPDSVFGFYGEEGAGLEDPSNLKRFITPVEGGGRFRVYVQQVSAKLVDVTVELYSNIVAVATVGTFQLAIS